MKLLQILPVMMLLAGCQSGLPDGSLQSSFPPEGWTTTKNEGRAQYVCNPPSCLSTELVLVDDLMIVGLSDDLIRDGKVSSETVAKIDAFIARQKDGTYRAEPAVPVTSENYAGFRHKAALTDAGRAIHISGQSVVQGNGGVMVLSLVHDRQTAEANLDTYLALTKVERTSKDT